MKYTPHIRQIFTITVALFSLPLMAQEPATSNPYAMADKVIEEGISNKQFPGAVLVIGRGDKTLYEKAYGKHTFEAEAKPMAMDTLFDMASVSKVVGTATTAMGLVEDGRLNIEAPVATYVNGFGAEGKDSVKVRHLLTHTSGLKSYESVDKIKRNQKNGISSADALIMTVAQLKLSNPVGTTVTYSCLNMLTEARVNENILGGRQDDYVTKRVYAPLGMKDTTYRPSSEQLTRTAPAVRKPDGTDLVGVVHDPLASFHSPELHCPGNAGVFSTGRDMARYCMMIAGQGTFNGNQIFRPETIKAMTSVQTPAGMSNLRGLGWDIYPSAPYATPLNNMDGKRVVAHTGYTGTFIWIDMNTKAWFVLLSNRTYPNDSRESSRGISRARRETAEIVLKNQPEYAEYFANQDKERSRR